METTSKDVCLPAPTVVVSVHEYCLICTYLTQLCVCIYVLVIVHSCVCAQCVMICMYSLDSYSWSSV